MRNSDAETAFRQTINWYSQNALEYHTITKDYTPDGREKFMVSLPQDGVVLDIGTTTGRDTNYFQKSGLKSVGIDIAKGCIRTAQALYPNANFLLADIRNLPFPSNFCDCIWMRSVLLHLPTRADVQQALKETKRVLKPKGICCIRVKLRTDKESELKLVTDSRVEEERLFRFFTRKEILKIVRESGLSVMQQQTYPDNTEPEKVECLNITATK
jgi:ubiquinone/menaquinone biosynthesis C-methylase UbiE